ncbi:amidohydrolase [Aspergillus insuetus]
MPVVDEIKAGIDAFVENASKRLGELNRQIWENPELAYEEHIAHDAFCALLEENGFEVTRHAHGLNTSFEASFGSGGRLIVFCAEYDALPDIGHACGHNLIGVASMTAFLALASVLKATGQSGRIRILGTPAEEHGGGKLDLLKAGVFEGVDVALMSHPMPDHYYAPKGSVGAGGARLVAKQSKLAEYKGRTAHPAANPWDGINALDAVVAGYNNVSLLRQQLHPTQRIHCAIIDTPKRTNIIADKTTIAWQCRSPKVADLGRLTERLCSCLNAGAMATGCKLDLKDETAYSDLLLNDTLCGLYQGHMASYNQNILKVDPDYIQASSDFGDVSYALPAIHAMFCIPVKEKGVVTHHWSFTEAAGSETAFQICLTVGKCLALCAWDMLTDDGRYEAAVADWKVARNE